MVIFKKIKLIHKGLRQGVQKTPEGILLALLVDKGAQRPEPKAPEFLHTSDKCSLLPQQGHVALRYAAPWPHATPPPAIIALRR